MRLILIRHAESEGNADGRIQGQVDLPLTPRGIEQAHSLARRLADRHLDHVYASPLLRADRTARILAEAKGMAVTALPGVMEYHFGDLSGLTRAEIRERHPELAAAGEGSAYLTWPGEEGRDVFRERVCGALWALEADHVDETIAVVSHGGAIAVFVASVLGLDPDRRAPLAIDNTALFEIEVRDGRGTLWTANDTCHLGSE